eukprot:gnl/Chilomastix_caulleri/2062.p2 GENE.gnl/Chilomastix_caulleri/2062~~gnl/Chilomastix_caulleri/2062.p2  ORF type:complete len:60 (+),score=9.99 gnl/Chilomastix_caulleri/2062:356-535(+)
MTLGVLVYWYILLSSWLCMSDCVCLIAVAWTWTWTCSGGTVKRWVAVGKAVEWLGGVWM